VVNGFHWHRSDPPPLDDLYQNHDDREDEQYVNESAHRV
jgi:hypothetical protein